MDVNVAKKSDQAKLPVGLRASLEELCLKVCNETAKRKLWAHRFTDADRAKFEDPPAEVLMKHEVPVLWHLARGTPTWNECIVEVAHALGFIHGPRREALLAGLGSEIVQRSSSSVRPTTLPHWDRETRELRYRGEVVRRVARLKQAGNIVPILDAFEAAGWPLRIDDPHRASRKGADGLRRDVSSLNEGLEKPRIKFASDGTGTGVVWLAMQQPRRPKAKKPRSQ